MEELTKHNGKMLIGTEPGSFESPTDHRFRNTNY
jgi:hypothetical protein